MFMKKTLSLALGAALLGLSSWGVADPDFSSDDSTVTLPVVTFDETQTLHNIRLTLREPQPGDITFVLTGFDTDTDKSIEFSMLLNGGNEVPAVASEGSGVGHFEIDLVTKELKGFVRLGNMTGVTAAHIHNAPEGSNGPAEFALQGGNDFLLVPKNTVLTDDQMDALKAGNLYVNVHTKAHPSGEIRGQLSTGIVRDVTTLLSGDQEVPAVTTEASGTALMRLNLRNGKLRGRVRVHGLENITGAHIHSGKPDENGSVLVALEAFGTPSTMENAFGNVVTVDHFRVPADTVLEKADRKALLRGNTYVNVHTEANPAGEVRGQLMAIK